MSPPPCLERPPPCLEPLPPRRGCGGGKDLGAALVVLGSLGFGIRRRREDVDPAEVEPPVDDDVPLLEIEPPPATQPGSSTTQQVPFATRLG